MLTKFTPDLFEPIHLPRIRWQQVGGTATGQFSASWSHLPRRAANEPRLARFQISSGYRACRWMKQLMCAANEN